jgi:hypothetical protein
VIAAPLAAWLVRHLAARVLGVAAGGLIVLTNADTVVKALGGGGPAELVVAVVLGVTWVAMIIWAVKQERLARELDPELEGETVAA